MPPRVFFIFLALSCTGFSSQLQFIEQPQSIITIDGHTFSLLCSATASLGQQPVLRYTWLHNNEVISVKDANSSTNGTLTVLNSQKGKDAGDYACIASSVDSSITSQKAEVKYAEMSSTFQEQPAETEVMLGQSFSFHCSLQSVPDPTFVWYFDFKPDDKQCHLTINKGTSTCTIENIMYDHTGHYRCDVTNAVLKETRRSNTGYLRVKGPPIFQTPPKGKVVGRGDPLELECSSQSYPTASVSWVLPSQQIINSSTGRFQILSNGSLKIENALTEDRGLYMCIASNIYGKIQAQASVNVLDGLTIPVIVDFPDKLFSVHGDSAFLMTCKAEGNPKPVITWQRVGKSLDLSRTSYPAPDILRISPVDRSDSGTYQCTATNSAGVVSKQTDFMVKAPPIVTTSLKSEVIGVYNQSFIFTCTVDAIPLAHVVWKLPNQTSVVADQQPSTTHVHEYRFTLGSVLLDQEGTYQCIASNEVGTGIVEVKMTVQGPPKLPKDSDLDYAVVLGSEWTLSCPLIGPPTPQYYWSFNNSIISSNRELSYPKAFKEQTGTYVCRGSNEYGSREVAVNVSIASPPVAKLLSDNISLAEFAPLNITCTASAKPAPLVSWLNNSKAALTVPRLNNAFLVLASVRRTDSGMYHCLATNVVGTSTASLLLDVLVPPSDIRITSNITVMEGDFAELQCSANGNQLPHLSWLIVFPNATEKQLCSNCNKITFGSIKPGNMGWYICTATNSLGFVTAWTYVDVRFKPTFEEKRVQILNRLGTDFQLSCNVRSNPLPVIHWVTPYGQWLTTPQLSFRNAIKSQSGVYTCVAENVLGVASQQIDLVLEGEPSIDQLSVSNTSTSNVLLQCLASGQPIPVISWVWINGETETILQNGSAYIVKREFLVTNNVQCMAQNKYGIQRLAVSVPQPPTNLAATLLSRTRVKITWQSLSSSHLLPLKGQVVQYRLTSPPASEWTKIYLKEDVHELNITTKIYSEYELSVASQNEFGWSKDSAILKFLSSPAEPSAATNLKVTTLNLTLASVTWEEPSALNGPSSDIHYQVTLLRNFQTTQSLLTKQRQTLLSGLEPAIIYNVTVTAGRQLEGTISWGPEVRREFKTGSPVPSVVPESIQIIQNGYSQLELHWNIEEQPATLTGFEIYYRRHGLDIGFQTLVVANPNVRSQVIGGLVSGTNYEIRIAATSTGGAGSQSQPMFGATVKETSSDTSKTSFWIWISIGSLGGVIFLLLVVVSVLVWRKRSSFRQDSMHPDDYLNDSDAGKRHFTLKFEDNKGAELEDDVHVKKFNIQDAMNTDLTYSMSEHMAREVDNPIFLVEARADAIVIGSRHGSEYGAYSFDKDSSPSSTLNSHTVHYSDALRCNSASPLEDGREISGLY